MMVLTAIGAVCLLLVVAVPMLRSGSTGNGNPAASPSARGASEPTENTTPDPHVLEVVDDGAAPVPTAAGLARDLQEPLASPALGPRVSAVVADVSSGQDLYATAGASIVPASTSKIVTAVAALRLVGPDTRLRTSVVAGPTPDSIVLVGGGDPTLAGPEHFRPLGRSPKLPRTDYPTFPPLSDLAAATAARLKAAGTTTVRLSVDASLFSGPTLGPGWSPGYVAAGDVAPVTALSVDGGRVSRSSRERSADPVAAAADAFAGLLRHSGVQVSGPYPPAKAAPDADVLAAVESAPVADLVEQMLVDSDNDLAEALARHAALRSGKPGSFAGASDALRAAAAELGVTDGGVAVRDGSGLSRESRIRPEALVLLLRQAASAEHPELRPAVTGLPVAGLTGTLAERYNAAQSRTAAGTVRAKTGTLSGVNTLAGLVQDADGRLLAFAFAAEGTASQDAARQALDRVAATLAACGCR